VTGSGVIGVTERAVFTVRTATPVSPDWK